MDEPVTAREVMNRSFVGVSEADAVAGAAQLMRDEAVHSAIVLRGSEPVGILDEDGLLDVVADRRDLDETTAGDVMRPAMTVDADQRIERAIGVMTTDDIRHVLVEESGELVGSISEHDILTAHSVLAAQPEPAEVQVGPAFGSDVADLDAEVYSTQGVCENCGALTRELATHNGQLVCPDCMTL